jgi:phosphoribosyl-ATP pyrophosphohydrolase/phosphoribosyl-AMP cyclohydrolase
MIDQKTVELLDWDKETPCGLMPTIVQDPDGQVLTLCYSSKESLLKTLLSGEAWYCSRTRGLWRKGATSGNTQRVVDVRVDCDNDALLFRVVPAGPGCHTGAWSCFGPREYSLGLLFDVIRDRKANPKAGSYTTSLFTDPKGATNKILEKFGEEAIELVIAAKETGTGEIATSNKTRIIEEMADVLYFLTVLMVEKGIEPGRVMKALEARR